MTHDLEHSPVMFERMIESATYEGKVPHQHIMENTLLNMLAYVV